MQRASLVLLLTFALLVPAACGSDPAAVVNDEVIPRDELEARVQQARDLAHEQGNPLTDPDDIDALRRDILDAMIDEVLVLQRGHEQGIDESHEEVRRQYDEFVAQFGGEDSLIAELERLDLTREELREFLVVQTVIEQNVNDRLAAEPDPPEEDIRAIYDDLGAYMDLPPYEEARPIILEQARALRWEELAADFVAGLREQAEIEVLL